ncbi:hypothetical protein GCWU000246_01773 [Jonquetella anthropi E3_33 E1]|nr:hypothetical protein GCWU000246_01773 [Jonquetella anthropi E3_33 E1]
MIVRLFARPDKGRQSADYLLSGWKARRLLFNPVQRRRENRRENGPQNSKKCFIILTRT